MRLSCTLAICGGVVRLLRGMGNIAYMEGDCLSGSLRTGAADATGGLGWVTIEVAAKAIRVNPRVIRKYIERGELEAKP